MKALLVQPPFVQLNSPYPAIHYLAVFLRSRGLEVRAADHSIALYRAIFSREGLRPVFAAARGKLSDAGTDATTASQLERYLSYEELYLQWVEPIVAFLSGCDPAFAHRASRAAEMPVGMRAQAYLDARDGSIEPQDARGLATAILEDLGDLVSFALDPGFATVRYGERIASSAPRFADIRAALDESPLLADAYAPLLAEEWARGPVDYLLISVPFPGCLLGALACARSYRSALGDGARIVIGGGYVNTELRELKDPGVFDYCDYLSFDSGFGSIAAILELGEARPEAPLYKAMYRAHGGSIVSGLGEDEAFRPWRELEDEAVASVEPDYRDADFRDYIQVVDSENAMHRLWSDSPWLKYRLAQGCYWRRCEFCDTELEYVARFERVRLGPLLEAADEASRRSGLFGIHFVDEAMPMAQLLAFASANKARALAGSRPFYYWGNVRFDGSWSADRCEYLAASGLVAVSGGIEIASEKGLAMTDKGFDLAGLVRTLVAMKSAGLLVHAYLIYGFPGQTRRDIQESADLCRQLFAAGLIDSGFWHRFVLTRHSRMYAEWKAGARPGLVPVDRDWDFANNDLRFEGEERYDEFDAPLAASLEEWMSGRGLEGALSGKIEGLIAQAEEALAAEKESRSGRAFWVAGQPLLRADKRGHGLVVWTYRGEARELRLPSEKAERACESLAALCRNAEGRAFAELEAELGLDVLDMAKLKESGLVLI